MKVHHVPPEIQGIKVGGKILDIEKGKWFTVGRRYKSREQGELKEVKPRIIKIENGEYNSFSPTSRNAYVNLLYLNLESAKGLYKDPENNLPYEIMSQYGELVYRQSVKETKKDIFNRLEKLAVEEGLRK
ncbi:MAG: hypothetical protein ACP5NZ_02710 [Nanobdellota archaeon]